MVRFIVEGLSPIPEGSTKGFIYNGRVKITHNNGVKLMEWRKQVGLAYQSSGGNYHHDNPIEIDIRFYFPRPKTVKKSKRPYMIVKPDIDKLCRGLIDGLTGIAFDDDCQIVSLRATKEYNDGMDWFGAEVELKEVTAI